MTAWKQLTKTEQGEVRELVDLLRTHDIFESVSQVAQNLEDAHEWAAGRLPLDDLCTRTGWLTRAEQDAGQAAPEDELQPTHADHNGTRVLLLTWRQLRPVISLRGTRVVNLKLAGGYDFAQPVTGEYEFVSGDPSREPQDDDLVYATIKVDAGRAGRPVVGPKIEARVPEDLAKRVDAYAARTSRSRADAIRVLIAAGLDKAAPKD